MRFYFIALVVLQPDNGGFYSSCSSYFRGRDFILMPSSGMVFVGGFNHGYH